MSVMLWPSDRVLDLKVSLVYSFVISSILTHFGHLFSDTCLILSCIKTEVQIKDFFITGCDIPALCHTSVIVCTLSSKYVFHCMWTYTCCIYTYSSSLGLVFCISVSCTLYTQGYCTGIGQLNRLGTSQACFTALYHFCRNQCFRCLYQ